MHNDCSLTIAQLGPLLRRRMLSPVELTRFLLERISRLQPAINAFITVTPEEALAQARKAEREIVKRDYRGPLHGIPISIKDIFYTRGIRTTAGSKILESFIPDEDAPVVKRLRRAGCVLLGKTNMHEFAYGPTNLNPHYGAVRNPWNCDRMSGGSSGGSAASVISGQAIASFGTDTGGSIRIPAAACGCVGFKPTCGRISLKGVVPLSTTLDHAGPLSRCVMDAALLFDAVRDPMQPACRPTADRIGRAVDAVPVGVPRQYFFDHIHPDVRRAVLKAAEVFEQLGAEIHEVDLHGMDETAALAADITGAEALAYHEKWLAVERDRYGEDVRTRLEQTKSLTASAYINALARRRAYAERFDAVMNEVRVLVAPTLPVAAPPLDAREIRIGAWREDVRLALLRLTRPGNVSGLPSITVPCGFTSEMLPIGLQLFGRRFDDATLLRAAHAYEQATPWHRQFPPDMFSE